ncbi:MAG: T9SS type A sorting domain-containing protein [Ignavibacteriales bacterium]|nr:T9SS type A sorting domain-containing protein [Ignavibacteriales bacterium]
MSVEAMAGNTVIATAVDQTISGINYVFTNWNNGSISRTTTFTQEGTYAANFVRVISATMSGPTSLSNGQSGTYAVTASGGKSPYTYSWSYYVHCNEVLSLNASAEMGEITPDNVPCGSWFSIYNTTNTVTRTSDGRTFDLKCVVTDANYSTYTVTKTVSGSALMKQNFDDESSVIAVENENYAESLETNPNPFNPTTRISFAIPNAGHVSLKVYDILGREVAELANKIFSAGRYEYEFNGSSLPSGIYITALVTEKNTLTKKIMLVK